MIGTLTVAESCCEQCDGIPCLVDAMVVNLVPGWPTSGTAIPLSQVATGKRNITRSFKRGTEQECPAVNEAVATLDGEAVDIPSSECFLSKVTYLGFIWRINKAKYGLRKEKRSEESVESVETPLKNCDTAAAFEFFNDSTEKWITFSESEVDFVVNYLSQVGQDSADFTSGALLKDVLHPGSCSERHTWDGENAVVGQIGGTKESFSEPPELVTRQVKF